MHVYPCTDVEKGLKRKHACLSGFYPCINSNNTLYDKFNKISVLSNNTFYDKEGVSPASMHGFP